MKSPGSSKPSQQKERSLRATGLEWKGTKGTGKGSSSAWGEGSPRGGKSRVKRFITSWGTLWVRAPAGSTGKSRCSRTAKRRGEISISGSVGKGGGGGGGGVGGGGLGFAQGLVRKYLQKS